MTNEEFIKEVFEIAFGDGARCVENNDNEVKAREFTKEEVLEQLKEFSDDAIPDIQGDFKEEEEE
jgi:hypothetical protein